MEQEIHIIFRFNLAIENIRHKAIVFPLKTEMTRVKKMVDMNWLRV